MSLVNQRLFCWADGSVRVDTSLLYPPFRDKLDGMLSLCEAQGRRYYAIRGYDSPEAQKALFLLWTSGKGGQASPPWQSLHQVGLAVDFNLDEDMARAGLQLPKTPRTAKHFKVLVDAARTVGLVSGADFNDAPHVQWASRFSSGASIRPLRTVWEASTGTVGEKLSRVWQSVGSAGGSGGFP